MKKYGKRYNQAKENISDTETSKEESKCGNNTNRIKFKVMLIKILIVLIVANLMAWFFCLKNANGIMHVRSIATISKK